MAKTVYGLQRKRQLPCDRIMNKDHDKLFTFPRVPEVEPTNNHAERSLRFPASCAGSVSDTVAGRIGWP